MIYSFETLPAEKTDVGGKAYMLAMMGQMDFNVPYGLILGAIPTEDEKTKILEAFDFDSCSLAVRSSASGEDSKEHSFAEASVGR